MITKFPIAKQHFPMITCTKKIYVNSDLFLVQIYKSHGKENHCDCKINQSLLSQLLFIYLFGVLRRFEHCTGHITTGSWKGRGNQYIQLVKVLYCKLPTNGKQLSAFPLEVEP